MYCYIVGDVDYCCDNCDNCEHYEEPDKENVNELDDELNEDKEDEIEVSLSIDKIIDIIDDMDLSENDYYTLQNVKREIENLMK